jgi:hypothetical protein
VSTPYPFSYAVVRVVPHVEREEFVNAGVVLFCEPLDFLGGRMALDDSRVRALSADVDLALVRKHLDAITRICAGGVSAGAVGALPTRERWRWLTAARSTILQTSPAHSGLCLHPTRELDRLLALLVGVRGG